MNRVFKSRSGATAIEYALIAGVIAIVIVSALTTIGAKTAQSFANVAAAM